MSVLVLATSIIRSQKSRSLLAFITLLINKRICNTCISVLSEHLLFSELRWNRSLFSELVWNISGFSKSFLVASCSFHFGVTVEFSGKLPILPTDAPSSQHRPVSDERRAARIFTCALTAPALPVRPKHMLSAQLEGRDGDPEID